MNKRFAYICFCSCYNIIYIGFIILFTTIIILNINDKSCSNIGLPLQYYDIIMLLENTIFMFFLNIIFFVTCIKNNKNYYTICILITIIQLVIIIIFGIIGIIKLDSLYGVCFEDIKILWFSSLGYLILNLLNGTLCILQMIIAKNIFIQDTNEYQIIEYSNDVYDPIFVITDY